jgi:POLQ-like helicase
MLHRVVACEQTVWRVADDFRVSRGFLQNLLQSAAVYSSCLATFCEELRQQFWALSAVLPVFTKRLAFGVRHELVALMEIPGIKQARARQLFSAGFKT